MTTLCKCSLPPAESMSCREILCWAQAEFQGTFLDWSPCSPLRLLPCFWVGTREEEGPEMVCVCVHGTDDLAGICAGKPCSHPGLLLSWLTVPRTQGPL